MSEVHTPVEIRSSKFLAHSSVVLKFCDAETRKTCLINVFNKEMAATD